MTNNYKNVRQSLQENKYGQIFSLITSKNKLIQ